MKIYHKSYKIVWLLVVYPPPKSEASALHSKLKSNAGNIKRSWRSVLKAESWKLIGAECCKVAEFKNSSYARRCKSLNRWTREGMTVYGCSFNFSAGSIRKFIRNSLMKLWSRNLSLLKLEIFCYEIKVCYSRNDSW